MVKSICSGEHTKEKVSGKREGAQREIVVSLSSLSSGALLPWPWCSQTGLADRMIDCFVKGPRVRLELEALCLS